MVKFSIYLNSLVFVMSSITLKRVATRKNCLDALHQYILAVPHGSLSCIWFGLLSRIVLFWVLRRTTSSEQLVRNNIYLTDIFEIRGTY